MPVNTDIEIICRSDTQKNHLGEEVGRNYGSDVVAVKKLVKIDRCIALKKKKIIKNFPKKCQSSVINVIIGRSDRRLSLTFQSRFYLILKNDLIILTCLYTITVITNIIHFKTNNKRATFNVIYQRNRNKIKNCKNCNKKLFDFNSGMVADSKHTWQ